MFGYPENEICRIKVNKLRLCAKKSLNLAIISVYCWCEGPRLETSAERLLNASNGR